MLFYPCVILKYCHYLVLNPVQEQERINCSEIGWKLLLANLLGVLLMLVEENRSDLQPTCVEIMRNCINIEIVSPDS